ncbi:hypothetical protein P8452_40999 [Trifolium repens]|nr:hypothetical protein P8452_40999 [Trifolium repens]
MQPTEAATKVSNKTKQKATEEKKQQHNSSSKAARNNQEKAAPTSQAPNRRSSRGHAAATRDADTYKPQTARPQPTKTQAHTQPDHHHLSKQFTGSQDHS